MICCVTKVGSVAEGSFDKVKNISMEHLKAIGFQEEIICFIPFNGSLTEGQLLTEALRCPSGE